MVCLEIRLMNLSFSGKEAGRGCFVCLFVWFGFLLLLLLFVCVFNAGLLLLSFFSMPVPSVDENSR